MLKKLRSALPALLFAASVAAADTVPVPAAQISRAVNAHADWLADAKQCPLQFVAAREAAATAAEQICRQAGGANVCMAQCERGDGGSCYWLGVSLQQSGGEPKSYAALYQRACRLGTMAGCTNAAAGQLDTSERGVESQRCTARTFEKVCAFNDPWACTMLALQLSRGLGVPKDPARALTVLQKSCLHDDNDEACIYGMQLKADIEAAQRSRR